MRVQSAAPAVEALKEWGSAWSAGRLASASGGAPRRQGAALAREGALIMAFAAGLTLCAGAGLAERGIAPSKEPASSAEALGAAEAALSQKRAWDKIKAGLGWLWGEPKTGRAPSEPEESLAPLPVKLPGGGEAPWSDLRLARELLEKDPFMALTVAVERLPERGYMDSAGANAGAGYCVSRRLRDHGEEVVRSDLLAAGFSASQAKELMSEEPRRVEAVEVTQAQGLRLLALMKPSYERLAISAVGEELWSTLAENKKAALSYLAYNTGNVGSFKKLLEAAKRGDDAEALRQMSVAWRDKKGRSQKNHRLRAWAQAAWASRGTLGEAVRQPLIFELSFAGSRGQESFIRAALKRGQKRGMEVQRLSLSENLERRQKEQAQRDQADREREELARKAKKPGKLAAALKKARDQKLAREKARPAAAKAKAKPAQRAPKSSAKKRMA